MAEHICEKRSIAVILHEITDKHNLLIAGFQCPPVVAPEQCPDILG
jgi:hypothetical protein